MRSPGVVTELVGWMLKRGSEQRKRRLLKKVISCVKWIHKLWSCCLQCQNWPREGSLEQTPALMKGVCAEPEHWHWRHPGRRFSIPALTSICRPSHPSPGRAKTHPKSPRKLCSDIRVCTLILTSLSRLFSIFAFHFVSREEDVSTVIALSCDWRWKH